jgi:hypothetical protein
MEVNNFSSIFNIIMDNLLSIFILIVCFVFVVFFLLYLNRKSKSKIETDMIMDVDADASLLRNNTLEQQVIILRRQVINLKNQHQQCLTKLKNSSQQQIARFIRIERNPAINQPLMLNLNEIQIFDEKGNQIRDNLRPRLYPQYGNPNSFGPQYLVNNVLTSRLVILDQNRRILSSLPLNIIRDVYDINVSKNSLRFR